MKKWLLKECDKFSEKYLLAVALLFTGMGIIGFLINRNPNIFILQQVGLCLALLIPCGIVVFIFLFVKLILHR